MRTKQQDARTRAEIDRKRKLSAQRKDKSLVIVFTGDGKGKTSAAVMMAFRTVAHNNWRAAVVQFMKSPKDFKYGEQIVAEKIPGLDFFMMGDGFTWDTNNRKLDIVTTRRTWEKCKACVRSGKYRLVVWDEINYVIQYGFLKVSEVAAFLKRRPPHVHIVLTGRGAKPAIVRLANLVTEMKDIKHPYRLEGLIAQKGIEY